MLSPNPVYSDLLQNNNFYKWQPIGRAFLINTKDFEIQKNILKFFILRKSIPTDEGGGKFLKNQYIAELKINCDPRLNSNQSDKDYQKIQKYSDLSEEFKKWHRSYNHFDYLLYEEFCT